MKSIVQTSSAGAGSAFPNALEDGPSRRAPISFARSSLRATLPPTKSTSSACMPKTACRSIGLPTQVERSSRFYQLENGFYLVALQAKHGETV